MAVVLFWQDLGFSGAAPSLGEKAFKGDFAGIPREYAEKRYSKNFDGKEFVVHIQDAHDSLGAQKSIAKVLEALSRDYDMSLVGIEGSTGDVDTGLISSIPVESVRRGVAESLLSETKISAAEFQSIVSGGDTRIFGSEDRELYSRNLADFQKVILARPRAAAEVEKLRKILYALEQKLFSPAMLGLIGDRRLQEKGEIGFDEYFRRLRTLGSAHGLSCEDYPNLGRIVRALEIEERIDFVKADGQRTDLILKLKEKLSPAAAQEMVLKTMQAKLGRLSAGRFHAYLAGLIPQSGAFEKEFPDLVLYARYASLFDDVDLFSVFRETAAFEAAVREKLFRSDAERRLYGFVESLDLSEKLLDASLSEEEYTRLLAIEKESGLDRMQVYLGGAASGVDFPKLLACVPSALSFYRGARARNQALLDNLLNRMKRSGAQSAALVTGGFHSGGLAECMEKKLVSHIVILPKFDEKSGKRPYFAVITQKGSYLDRETKRQALREAAALALWTAVEEGMSFPRARALCAGPAVPESPEAPEFSESKTETVSEASAESDARRRALASSSIFADSVYSRAEQRELFLGAVQKGRFIAVGGEAFECLRRDVSGKWVPYVVSAGADRSPEAVPSPAGVSEPRRAFVHPGPGEAEEIRAVDAASRRFVAAMLHRADWRSWTEGRLQMEASSFIETRLRRKRFEPSDLSLGSKKHLYHRVRQVTLNLAAKSAADDRRTLSLSASRRSSRDSAFKLAQKIAARPAETAQAEMAKDEAPAAFETASDPFFWTALPPAAAIALFTDRVSGARLAGRKGRIHAMLSLERLEDRDVPNIAPIFGGEAVPLVVPSHDYDMTPAHVGRFESPFHDMDRGRMDAGYEVDLRPAGSGPALAGRNFLGHDFLGGVDVSGRDSIVGSNFLGVDRSVARPDDFFPQVDSYEPLSAIPLGAHTVPVSTQAIDAVFGAQSDVRVDDSALDAIFSAAPISIHEELNSKLADVTSSSEMDVVRQTSGQVTVDIQTSSFAHYYEAIYAELSAKYGETTARELVDSLEVRFYSPSWNLVGEISLKQLHDQHSHGEQTVTLTLNGLRPEDSNVTAKLSSSDSRMAVHDEGMQLPVQRASGGGSSSSSSSSNAPRSSGTSGGGSGSGVSGTSSSSSSSSSRGGETPSSRTVVLASHEIEPVTIEENQPQKPMAEGPTEEEALQRAREADARARAEAARRSTGPTQTASATGSGSTSEKPAPPSGNLPSPVAAAPPSVFSALLFTVFTLGLGFIFLMMVNRWPGMSRWGAAPARGRREEEEDSRGTRRPLPDAHRATGQIAAMLTLIGDTRWRPSSDDTVVPIASLLGDIPLSVPGGLGLDALAEETGAPLTFEHELGWTDHLDIPTSVSDAGDRLQDALTVADENGVEIDPRVTDPDRIYRIVRVELRARARAVIAREGEKRQRTERLTREVLREAAEMSMDTSEWTHVPLEEMQRRVIAERDRRVKESERSLAAREGEEMKRLASLIDQARAEDLTIDPSWTRSDQVFRALLRHRVRKAGERREAEERAAREALTQALREADEQFGIRFEEGDVPSSAEDVRRQVALILQRRDEDLRRLARAADHDALQQVLIMVETMRGEGLLGLDVEVPPGVIEQGSAAVQDWLLRQTQEPIGARLAEASFRAEIRGLREVLRRGEAALAADDLALQRALELARSFDLEPPHGADAYDVYQFIDNTLKARQTALEAELPAVDPMALEFARICLEETGLLVPEDIVYRGTDAVMKYVDAHVRSASAARLAGGRWRFFTHPLVMPALLLLILAFTLYSYTSFNSGHPVIDLNPQTKVVREDPKGTLQWQKLPAPAAGIPAPPAIIRPFAGKSWRDLERMLPDLAERRKGFDSRIAAQEVRLGSYEKTKAARQSQLDTARQVLAAARVEYRRASDLYTKNAIAAQEYERYGLAVKKAEGRVAEIQSGIEEIIELMRGVEPAIRAINVEFQQMLRDYVLDRAVDRNFKAALILHLAEENRPESYGFLLQCFEGLDAAYPNVLTNEAQRDQYLPIREALVHGMKIMGHKRGKNKAELDMLLEVEARWRKAAQVPYSLTSLQSLIAWSGGAVPELFEASDPTMRYPLIYKQYEFEGPTAYRVRSTAELDEKRAPLMEPGRPIFGMSDGDHAKILEAVKKGYGPEIDLLLSDVSPVVRANTVWALESPFYIAQVIAMSKDPHPQVRTAVAKRLGQWKPSPGMPANWQDIRIPVFRALGSVEDPSNDLDTRRAAAQGWASVQDPSQAVQDFRSVLMNLKEKDIVKAEMIAVAADHWRSPLFLPALLDFLAAPAQQTSFNQQALPGLQGSLLWLPARDAASLIVLTHKKDSFVHAELNSRINSALANREQGYYLYVLLPLVRQMGPEGQDFETLTHSQDARVVSVLHYVQQFWQFVLFIFAVTVWAYIQRTFFKAASRHGAGEKLEDLLDARTETAAAPVRPHSGRELDLPAEDPEQAWIKSNLGDFLDEMESRLKEWNDFESTSGARLSNVNALRLRFHLPFLRKFHELPHPLRIRDVPKQKLPEIERMVHGLQDYVHNLLKKKEQLDLVDPSTVKDADKLAFYAEKQDLDDLIDDSKDLLEYFTLYMGMLLWSHELYRYIGYRTYVWAFLRHLFGHEKMKNVPMEELTVLYERLDGVRAHLLRRAGWKPVDGEEPLLDPAAGRSERLSASAARIEVFLQDIINPHGGRTTEEDEEVVEQRVSISSDIDRSVGNRQNITRLLSVAATVVTTVGYVFYGSHDIQTAWQALNFDISQTVLFSAVLAVFLSVLWIIPMSARVILSALVFAGLGILGYITGQLFYSQMLNLLISGFFGILTCGFILILSLAFHNAGADGQHQTARLRLEKPLRVVEKLKETVKKFPEMRRRLHIPIIKENAPDAPLAKNRIRRFAAHQERIATAAGAIADRVASDPSANPLDILIVSIGPLRGDEDRLRVEIYRQLFARNPLLKGVQLLIVPDYVPGGPSAGGSSGIDGSLLGLMRVARLLDVRKDATLPGETLTAKDLLEHILKDEQVRRINFPEPVVAQAFADKIRRGLPRSAVQVGVYLAGDNWRASTAPVPVSRMHPFEYPELQLNAPISHYPRVVFDDNVTKLVLGAEDHRTHYPAGRYSRDPFILFTNADIFSPAAEPESAGTDEAFFSIGFAPLEDVVDQGLTSVVATSDGSLFKLIDRGSESTIRNAFTDVDTEALSGYSFVPANPEVPTQMVLAGFWGGPFKPYHFRLLQNISNLLDAAARQKIGGQNLLQIIDKAADDAGLKGFTISRFYTVPLIRLSQKERGENLETYFGHLKKTILDRVPDAEKKRQVTYFFSELELVYQTSGLPDNFPPFKAVVEDPSISLTLRLGSDETAPTAAMADAMRKSGIPPEALPNKINPLRVPELRPSAARLAASSKPAAAPAVSSADSVPSSRLRRDVFVSIDGARLAAVLPSVAETASRRPGQCVRVLASGKNVSGENLRTFRRFGKVAVLQVSEAAVLRTASRASFVRVDGVSGRLSAALERGLVEAGREAVVRRLEATLGRPLTLDDVLNEDTLNHALTRLPASEKEKLLLEFLPALTRLDVEMLAAISPFYEVPEFTLTDAQAGRFRDAAVQGGVRVPQVIVTPSVLSKQVPIALQRRMLAAQLGVTAGEIKLTLAVKAGGELPEDALARLVREGVIGQDDVAGAIAVEGDGARIATSRAYASLLAVLREKNGPDFELDPSDVRMAGRGEFYLDNETVDRRDVNRSLTVLEIGGDRPYPWVLVKLFQLAERGTITLFTPRPVDWAQFRSAVEGARRTGAAA